MDYVNRIYSKFRDKRLLSEEGVYLTDFGYNLIISALLCLGFIVNWVIVTFAGDRLASHYKGVVLPGLFLYIISAFLIFASDTWFISLVGYFLTSIAVSFTLSSIVAQYNDVVVSKAFLFTAIIVIISTVISMLYPDLVTSLINYLFFIIIVVLALSFTMWALFPLWFNVLDYIIVLTFSVMYGYNFIRAQDYPKTLDNAIDSAADLYLDIICLFIKLLSITNKED